MAGWGGSQWGDSPWGAGEDDDSDTTPVPGAVKIPNPWSRRPGGKFSVVASRFVMTTAHASDEDGWPSGVVASGRRIPT